MVRAKGTGQDTIAYDDEDRAVDIDHLEKPIRDALDDLEYDDTR